MTKSTPPSTPLAYATQHANVLLNVYDTEIGGEWLRMERELHHLHHAIFILQTRCLQQ